jgi:L-ribulose-5-phosphate 3-epimerase
MDDTENIRRLVDVLKEVCPRAEKAGLVLGLEDYLSAEDNVRIMDRVRSPALQVYYDVGNSTDKGYDILKEIRLLGRERICEFHVKDGGQLLGKGRIDFREVRKAIDDIGYSGWLQIEGKTPNDLVPDYTADLAYLRALFPPPG